MNYKRIHQCLIDRALSRTLSEYTETHHIIPRCLGGLDDQTNLVELTPAEHRLVHLLLVKLHPGNKSIAWAAHNMFVSTRHHKRSKSKTYGWLREQMRDHMVGANNPMFGKKRPDVSARNSATKGTGHPRVLKGCGKGGKGQPKSLAHRQAMSEAGKRAWIARREMRGTQNY